MDNRSLEEAFYKVLGEGYRKFLATGFKFQGAEIVRENVKGSTLTMYQGAWKGVDQMDGVVRKLSVKKESIDKILGEVAND